MQEFHKKKAAFGICVLSTLYVVLVVLIPILGFGAKGSGTNTSLKAVIFIVYLFAFLFLSRFRISISIGSGCILLFYLVSQLFNILFSNYSVSAVSVLIQLAVLFTVLFMLPSARSQKEDIITGIRVFVLFNLVAIIYNIILHFDRYFSLSFLTNVYYDMYSFFDNKNTYGMTLFVAFILLFYWHSLCEESDKTAKRRIIILICLQFFAIATSMCRTALLCSLVFLFLNYMNKVTLKKLLLTIALVVIGAGIFAIPSVREYLLYVLFRVDVGTFREPIENASKEIIRDNILFGCGQGSWEPILEKISGNPYSHNGFLSVLMTGGLTYFLAYMGLFLRALKCAIRVRKANHKLGSQFVFFLIAIVIYSLYESVVLCEANAANFSFTIAALIMPQLYCNLLEDSPQAFDAKKENCVNGQANYSTDMAVSSLQILSKKIKT